MSNPWRYRFWKRTKKYKFNLKENSDFRLVAQKRVTNNPKNPYTIGTDYRAITQKRVTAQGNITT